MCDVRGYASRVLLHMLRQALPMFRVLLVQQLHQKVL